MHLRWFQIKKTFGLHSLFTDTPVIHIYKYRWKEPESTIVVIVNWYVFEITVEICIATHVDL